MSEAQIPHPDEHNVWRLETDGASQSWERSPYPDAENKYFMVSADGHVQEPKDLWVKRVPEEYHHRLPGVSRSDKGEQFQKTEGFRPTKINLTPLEGEDLFRNQSGRSPDARVTASSLMKILSFQFLLVAF